MLWRSNFVLKAATNNRTGKRGVWQCGAFCTAVLWHFGVGGGGLYFGVYDDTTVVSLFLQLQPARGVSAILVRFNFISRIVYCAR